MDTKIYEIINNRIIDLLNHDVIPWRKPWKPGDAPKNYRGTMYRGINVWILEATRESKNYPSNVWLTFNQVKNEGGNVKGGEHGTPVIFWKFIEIKDNTSKNGKKNIPLLRYYTVFNYAQCENLKPLPITDSVIPLPIEGLQAIYENMQNKPALTHGGNSAYYQPIKDTVNLPLLAQFELNVGYYATLYHELGHSTGHESRLGRFNKEMPVHFGDNDYSREELVAEMTSAFLCGSTGIENITIENAAGYIQHWVKVLQNDKTAIVWAGGQAQKAADYILGTFKKEVEEE